MGGLGNQLFQIFTTIAYSLKHKRNFGFIYTEFVGVGKTNRRNTYWNTFFKYIQKYVFISIPITTYIKEDDFHYSILENPNLIHKNENENICLYGYFQSYKYFENYTSIIIRLLNIDFIRYKVIDKSKFNPLDLTNSISMHFRFGDYKKIPDHYPLLTFDYYDNCIYYLLNNQLKNNINPFINILYFCEEEDIMDVLDIIDKLKIKYKMLNFIKVSSELFDWEQLLLMSCCKYNIIANSTFSWWAAYLNNNIEKVVCYPDKWFGDKKKHLNTKDLFLPSWKKIKL
jgi:hypothetical protein